MGFREYLQRQPVLPAPMCGISDFPFREICRRAGAELTTTQMVASEAVVRNPNLDKSLEVLDMDAGCVEANVGVQVFGAEPEALARACEVVQERGAAWIDLNMGCPATKITCSRSGSALLKDLPRVARILKAMRAVTRVPLTVKLRWDWDDKAAENGQPAALEAVRIAEAEGLDGVCLHARTRAQGYSGAANWELIGALKAAVNLPVIGNGDIRQPADALAMMRQSGCDAVMIGRALIGDPWLLGETLTAVRSGEAPASRRGPDWEMRRQMMLAHAGAMVARRGERALVLFRKHAVAYLRGVQGGKRVRERLMQALTWAEFEDLLARDPALADEYQEAGATIGAGTVLPMTQARED